MLKHGCALFLMVLRNSFCEEPVSELPFYEPLSYAGLARVDLLYPRGINFSITGK